MKVFRPVHVATSLVVLVAATVFSATAATASQSSASAATKPCAFQLRIGTVLPFTGDLATYGGNIDKAVRLAIRCKTGRWRSWGSRARSRSSSSTRRTARRRLPHRSRRRRRRSGEHVNVIIGEMASGATIPMAQSVTIPNKVVLISPTASAPQITALKDNGYVWRAYPSDTFQGKVLATAAVAKFGRGATINVGARNDAFGTALQQLFVASGRNWAGRSASDLVESGPGDVRHRGAEAGRRQPGGLGHHRLPRDVPEVRAVPCSQGQWSASKTLMTEACERQTCSTRSGGPVDGLSGSAASAAGGAGRQGVRCALEQVGEGREAVHGLRGHVVRRGDGRLPGGGPRLLVARRQRSRRNLRAISGPPGLEGDLPATRGGRARPRLAGKDVNYEGAFSPVDFDAKGDIGSAVYEIWQYNGNGQIQTLRTITFRG